MQKEYLEFAKKLALQADEVMLKYFDTNVTSWTKEDKTIVTVADEEINTLVIEAVAEKYPEHSVLGEEASADKGSEFVWVCDPIDGTVPFSRGIPISVFSLALVKNGEPIVGVVYDPYTKRMYTAIKGKGAFLNDRPIKVSYKKLGMSAMANNEWWPSAEFDVAKPMYDLEKETGTYIVSMGCTAQASCLVASGKMEANVFPGTKGKAVDIAAIKVIVEEAGGKVTDINGNEQRYDRDINGAVISNGHVHDEIISYLSQA